MAIVPMRRMQLCALRKDRKPLLELLQRRGAVEISDGGDGDEVFHHADTSATRTLLDKNAETAKEALEVLNKYSREEKGKLAFLQGRKAVTVQANADFYKTKDRALRDAQRILQLERDISEAKAEKLRLEANREALKPWLGLDVPLTFRGTKTTAVFIGTLDGERTLDDILAELAEAAPELKALHVEVLGGGKSQTCLYVIAPKAKAEETDAALRSIGFARPAYSTSQLPKNKDAKLERRWQAAEDERTKAEEEICSLAGTREDLRFLEDHMAMRSEKYEAIEKLRLSRHTFVLEGYVPQPVVGQLAKELTSRFTCAVEILPVAETDEAPVQLHNSWFTEPTESVLESYSLPGKGELDPTSVMSIFYYIMFGLMFSDAAYGLIMVLVCGGCLLKFRKNLEPNWSRNLRMFFWCGVSTTFWGIVFSSYFGDVVDSVSSTFFGTTVSIQPLWFAPLDDPMKLLVFCLGVGIVHLTVGYIMKGITCAKNKDMLGILWDAVLPVAIIYPLILLLMGSEIFLSLSGFMLTLPAVATTVCLAISGVCAVGIIFTGGRESKNWGKRILKGVYSLYNVLSGWLSDTLSYSRLLALGLATGVIGMVMNQLAGLAGGSLPFVIGFLIYLVIFAVGHALNFGINVLGAYVHSNRLEYVEFFGKFYDGGGRKFQPFGVHTKHYKIIEEDTQNV